MIYLTHIVLEVVLVITDPSEFSKTDPGNEEEVKELEETIDEEKVREISRKVRSSLDGDNSKKDNLEGF